MELFVSDPLPQTNSKNFSDLEELYQLYGCQSFGLALHILADSTLAEEMVQEVFLRYWKQPTLFTGQDGPFINWLLREIHCSCLKRLKDNFGIPQRSRLSTALNSTGTTLKKDLPMPTEKEQGITGLQTRVQQALTSLPQQQRQILEMAFFKGLTYQEIAQATGQSNQAIRQTLTRGLVQLKEVLAH